MLRLRGGIGKPSTERRSETFARTSIAPHDERLRRSGAYGAFRR
jgi:hypothetical protein